MKRKEGISLIVLVLTIVVIVILATAVILSISNNNPIENANKAKFLNDIKSFEEDYTLRMLNSYFDLDEERDITIADLTEDEEYRKKLTIKDDKIYLVESEVTEKEIEWASEVGIECISLPWDGISIDTAWYDNNKNKTEFEISTASELAGLAKLVNEGTEQFDGKTINLMSNIDLNNQEWVPIGIDISIDLCNPFLGCFQGNGCKISNMKIENCSFSSIGLFGEITGATIQGIILENSKIISDNNVYVGGIVGYADLNNLIRPNIVNCASVNNDIRSKGSVGGIIGDSLGAIIECCYNSSYVENTSKSSKENWTAISNSGDRAGGIIGGCVDGVDILDCYNTGTIIAENTRAGGIAGVCQIYYISNCYNVGTISGACSGELFGMLDRSNIQDCYYLSSKDAVGKFSIELEEWEQGSGEYYIVYPVSTEELKNSFESLGSSWKKDTNNINNGYPILSWQE